MTRTEVTGDRGNRPDDPGAADGDAAGPGGGQGPGRRARRLHPADPAAPHQPGHRRGRHVLVPCGHTLAHVCPSCAERARTLRAAQCREGWHLEDEPDITPDPATDDQRFWVEKRAEAQQLRDQAASAGQDTTDLDELLTELDEEITKAGMRGKAAPAKPGAAAPLDPAPPGRPGPAPPQGQPAHGRQDLHRAGRQDVPPLAVRHPDLPVLRPGRRGRRTGRPRPPTTMTGRPGTR